MQPSLPRPAESKTGYVALANLSGVDFRSDAGTGLGTEFAAWNRMLRRIGAALHRAAGRTIRGLEEALSIAIILVMALAPAAGAIAVGYLLERRSIPVALLASASLAATVASALSLFRNRRNNRSRGKQPIPGHAEEPKEANDSPLEPLTNAMVTFHDFNPKRRRFDHW